MTRKIQIRHVAKFKAAGNQPCVWGNTTGLRPRWDGIYLRLSDAKS